MNRFFKMTILAASLICMNSNALIIKAEETSNKFLRISEYENGYYFEKCDQLLDSVKCNPLIDENTFYTRAELNSLSKSNYRNSLYAVGGDIAVVAAGILAGTYVGLGLGMYVLAYDGAALACGAFLTGTVPGALTGLAADIAFDNLDPFVHRDMAITYEAIMNTASKGDLEDVDASYFQNELSVVVEDIDYEQLEDKFVGQLGDLHKKKTKRIYRVPKIPSFRSF